MNSMTIIAKSPRWIRCLFLLLAATLLHANGAERAVAKVTISPAGGTFNNSKVVTLSCATAGATIRYTLNNTAPTLSSKKYTAAFKLIHSCKVRAKAFKSGLTESAGSSATFTIISSASTTGLSARTLDSSRIRLGWLNTAAAQASGMKIQRSSLAFSNGTYSQSAFVTIATTTAGKTIYTDSGLDAGTLYYYRVRPTNNAEPFSHSSAVTTAATPANVPAAPTNLRVYPDAPLEGESPQVLVLQFQRNAANETFYLFETSANPLDFAVNGAVPLGGLSTSGSDLIGVDQALPTSTKFYYRVRAINAAGVSEPTEVVSATTYASTNYTPTAPSGSTGIATSPTTGTLRWTNTSTWDGYDLRGDSNAALLDNADHQSDIDNASAGSSSSVIVPVIQVNPNTTYFFKVRVYRYIGGVRSYSPFTSVFSFTTPANQTVTGVNFTNNTGYPIVSLKIDGVEQFPSAPQGFAESTSYLSNLSAGSHTYTASNGYWEGSSRRTLYNFSSNFTVTSNAITSLTLNSPSAVQLLTRFSGAAKTWSGWYVGKSSYVAFASIVFNTNGTCSVYTQDGTANRMLYASGTYFYENGTYRGNYIQNVNLLLGGITYRGLFNEQDGSYGVRLPFSPYAVEYTSP